MTRSIAIVMLMLLGWPAAGYAQTEARAGVAASFEQLQVLVSPGNTVTVIDVAGSQASGRIDSLTPSVLSLDVNGPRRDFSEADVTVIRQRRGDSKPANPDSVHRVLPAAAAASPSGLDSDIRAGRVAGPVEPDARLRAPLREPRRANRRSVADGHCPHDARTILQGARRRGITADLPGNRQTRARAGPHAVLHQVRLAVPVAAGGRLVGPRARARGPALAWPPHVTRPT